MAKKKQDEKTRRAELQRCAEEIGAIRSGLDEAYAQFNSATDGDSLDACIFEISALRSRYNTAIKSYREKFY